MSVATLRELGFGDGLARHLQNYDRSSLLGYRCRPPYYWQSSSIAKQPITPLWECGTVLTYFHQLEELFYVCSLEDLGNVTANYKSAQALLAALLVDLFEDELTYQDLRTVAKEIGFKHIDRMLSEVERNSGPLYGAWRDRFPSTCEG